MFCVANMIAFSPEAQTLLMVVASEVLGILDESAICLLAQTGEAGPLHR